MDVTALSASSLTVLLLGVPVIEDPLHRVERSAVNNLLLLGHDSNAASGKESEVGFVRLRFRCKQILTVDLQIRRMSRIVKHCTRGPSYTGRLND